MRVIDMMIIVYADDDIYWGIKSELKHLKSYERKRRREIKKNIQTDFIPKSLKNLLTDEMIKKIRGYIFTKLKIENYVYKIFSNQFFKKNLIINALVFFTEDSIFETEFSLLFSFYDIAEKAIKKFFPHGIVSMIDLDNDDILFSFLERIIPEVRYFS